MINEVVLNMFGCGIFLINNFDNLYFYQVVLFEDMKEGGRNLVYKVIFCIYYVIEYVKFYCNICRVSIDCYFYYFFVFCVIFCILKLLCMV